MVAAGRREKYSQSLSGSQIAVAAVIGILLGCLTAFFFLHGSFTSYILPSKVNKQISKSNLQFSLKNAKLKQQVIELTQKLSVKRCPCGTSVTKGLRRKPSLIPDESLNLSLAKILTEAATHKVLIVALANLNVKTM